MSAKKIQITALRDVTTLLVVISATVRMDTYWTVIYTCAMVNNNISCSRNVQCVFPLCFIDVDECAMETSDCHNNATCSNTIGSYECTCVFGYTGDGFNCTCKF